MRVLVSVHRYGPVPPWYYGYAYHLPDRHEMVWAVMPLNVLLRVRKHVRAWWDEERMAPAIAAQERSAPRIKGIR